MTASSPMLMRGAQPGVSRKEPSRPRRPVFIEKSVQHGCGSGMSFESSPPISTMLLTFGIK